MGGGQKIGEMFYDVVANTGPAIRDLDKFKARAEAVGRSMQSVGRKMTMGLTLPILGIAAASVKAASDAEEMESMFDAVFKKSSADVRKWAAVHGDAVNRSKYDLMEYAASLQDTFVPMGFARDKAAVLSKAMVELAVDVASFKNKLEPEVIRDFQSAIVGNHETVRKYGIVITQAALDQELLNMGFAEGARNASEEMKVQARLNLIMKGTTDAQGDAARTAESFANQMKGLKGDLKEVAIELGKVLIPELKNLIKDGKPVLEWLKELTPAQRAWMVKIGLTVAAIGPLLIVVGKLITAFEVLAATATSAWAAVSGPVGISAAIGAGVYIGAKKIESTIEAGRERQMAQMERVYTGQGQYGEVTGIGAAPAPTWKQRVGSAVQGVGSWYEGVTGGAPPGLAGLLEKGFGEEYGLQVADMGEQFDALVKLVYQLAAGAKEGSEFASALDIMKSQLSTAKREAEGFEDLMAQMIETLIRTGQISEKVGDQLLELWIPFTRGAEEVTEEVADFGQQALDGLIADFTSPEAMRVISETYDAMAQEKLAAEQQVADLVNQTQTEQLDSYLQMQQEIAQEAADVAGLIQDIQMEQMAGLFEAEGIDPTNFEQVMAAWKEAIKKMGKEGADFADSLKSALGNAITEGIMAGKMSWDSLIDMIERTVINVAVNALVSGGSVGGALSKIPVIGGLLSGIGSIFGLAGGGTLQTAGSVMVGEQGPELLSLPAGAQVSPLGKLGNLTTVIELDGREIARKMLPLQAREMQLRGVM